MKKILFVLIFFILNVPALYAQTTFNALYGDWKGGQYKEVLKPLIEYLHSPNCDASEYAQVKYMIATSLCLIPQMHAQGCKYYQTLFDFNFDAQTTDDLKNEQASFCSNSEAAPKIDINKLLDFGNARFNAEFKFLMENCIKEFNRPHKKTALPKIESKEFYLKRRLSLDDTLAVEKLSQRVHSKTITATDHFIISSLGSQSKEMLISIGKMLEKTYSFYKDFYGIPAGRSFINIVLANSYSDFHNIASNLYGVDLPDYCIGYSSSLDKGIIALVQQTKTGTLNHELFHIMIRDGFPDIPLWLNEGLASLYEEAEWKNDTLKGKVNWRGCILTRYINSDKMPSIADLIKMDCNTFTNAEAIKNDNPNLIPSDEFIRQAVNYAAARYFMLYLQQTGQLHSFFNVFKETDTENLTVSLKDYKIKAAESVLGNLEEVNTKFVSWFNALPK